MVNNGKLLPWYDTPRCHAALQLDRFRFCSDCVEKNNAALQGSLFP